MLTTDEIAEATLREFVLTRAALGLYDPLHPRRPRVPVAEFTVEFFEIEDGLAHVAGPVILQGPTGAVKKFLRLSVPWEGSGSIPENAEVRAVYIEETNAASGACKETAALANA